MLLGGTSFVTIESIPITLLSPMETPFIISGKGVRKGGEFQESMMQFDVASTIAYIFDLEQPQVWIGRPMKQVFK